MIFLGYYKLATDTKPLFLSIVDPTKLPKRSFNVLCSCSFQLHSMTYKCSLELSLLPIQLCHGRSLDFLVIAWAKLLRPGHIMWQYIFDHHARVCLLCLSTSIILMLERNWSKPNLRSICVGGAMNLLAVFWQHYYTLIYCELCSFLYITCATFRSVC